MRLIDHIRAAIELHDDTEARIQYVLARYDAKRDSIRRQINREVAKQRKHVDTGSDERDAFTFNEHEYQFQLAGEKPFSVPGGDVDTQSVNKKNRAKKTAADHQFGGSTFDLIFEATLLAIFVVLCAAILASFWL